MKYLIMLFVAISVNAAEKVADTKNLTISPSAVSATMSGNLDGTNTYDRVFGNGVDSGCAHPTSDSSNNGSSYDVYEIHSPSGQNADIEVQLGTLGDSLVFVYCSFDPLNPMNMVAGVDDDGGVGLGSAIVPADGLALTAGTSYFVVVAGFNSADLGTYDLVLGGDLEFGPAAVLAPPTSVPTLSNTTLILLLLSLVIMASLYMKKKQNN